MSRIVLLTDPACVDAVAPVLQAAGAQVAVAITAADLAAALERQPGSRLLSVGSGVIVPGTVLGRLPGPAYNLHPGPPEYPGLYPAIYALYEGSPEFGITLHEMAPVVDSGAIVAVDRFPTPPRADRLALETAAFAALVTMLGRFAPALADTDRPLPRLAVAWSGRRRTRRDFNAMCDLPPDVSAEEFARRLRAVGEGPDHALTITRCGRKFRLVSDEGLPVVRGGRTAAS